MIPAAAIGQSDQNNPVSRSGSFAETVITFGVGFDVQLEAVQVVEGHSLEHRSAGLHQELCDRVGDQMEGLKLCV